MSSLNTLAKLTEIFYALKIVDPVTSSAARYFVVFLKVLAFCCILQMDRQDEVFFLDSHL